MVPAQPVADFMLSIIQIKKLLNDPSISDKEASQIRDACQGIVELAFESLIFDKNNQANQPLRQRCKTGLQQDEAQMRKPRKTVGGSVSAI